MGYLPCGITVPLRLVSVIFLEIDIFPLIYFLILSFVCFTAELVEYCSLDAIAECRQSGTEATTDDALPRVKKRGREGVRKNAKKSVPSSSEILPGWVMLRNLNLTLVLGRPWGEREGQRKVVQVAITVVSFAL